MSSGEGVIPGFAACVVAVLLHLGCDAWATAQPDVSGMQAAVAAGASVLFLADDHRFVAFNLTEACSVDNDLATAEGYVTALEAAAGSLKGRDVLLLGLGHVGRAAARRLSAHGATVFAVEPDEERVATAEEVGIEFESIDLAAGLARCGLIFDACPAAAIIDEPDLQPGTIAAVPGMPSAFTVAAQEALGVRHIHEPLAIGVAVMAARALL
jgi:pyrrolysine biosynthesis protein PylD